jgi:hypothetical protein
MVRVDDLVRYEVSPGTVGKKNAGPSVYREDFREVVHPDAEFIAKAREDVPDLAYECLSRGAQISDLKEAMRPLIARLDSLATADCGRGPEGCVCGNPELWREVEHARKILESVNP